jgi:hypothetical protein
VLDDLDGSRANGPRDACDQNPVTAHDPCLVAQKRERGDTAERKRRDFLERELCGFECDGAPSGIWLASSREMSAVGIWIVLDVGTAV